MTVDSITVGDLEEKEKNYAGGDAPVRVKKEKKEICTEPPLAYREPPSPVPSFKMHASTEYLEQLICDKQELHSSTLPLLHVSRLIEWEIKRVVSELSPSIDSSIPDEPEGKDKVVLEEKIVVPVDKYPNYNFVGRILGPRGMTAKQLEEETGCKIMVRGRGTCSTEPLHVAIICEDYPGRVEEKMKKAVEKINGLLCPPPEGRDELKRRQLIELSIINGTYRPTTATKLALQAPRLASPTFAPSNSFAFDHNRFTRDPTKSQYPHLAFSSDVSSFSSQSRPISSLHPSTSVLDDNQALLASLLAIQNPASPINGKELFNDYIRQLMNQQKNN